MSMPILVLKDYKMDSIAHYKNIIQNLIHQYASYKPSHGNINTEAVIDSKLEHYEVVQVDGMEIVVFMVVSFI